jgi:DNA-binding MarR family transcriptional regulator
MKYNLQQCIGARLRRLSRIADAHFRAELTDLDITENQMTILFALSKLGKIEQGKIGQNLVLERSTVSRNIKLLEKRNYLIRTEAYRPEVELTKEGKEFVQVLIPRWEKAMNKLISKLGMKGFELIEKLENRIE